MLVDFDPFSKEFIENPYPVLSVIQERQPVFRCKTGSWVLTRYGDVAAALSHTSLGNSPSPYSVLNSRNESKYACARMAAHILPFMDAPDHTRLRRIIGRPFHEALKQNPPHMEQKLLRLWSENSQRAEVDMITDIFTPWCVEVMGEIFGFPWHAGEPGLVADLKNWSDWFFYLFSIIPSDEVRDALDSNLLAFRGYLESLPGGGTDSWFQQVKETILAEGFSESHWWDACMLLISDGINADYALANAAATLMQHPDHLQFLRQQPEWIPVAVDELLRYDSPSLFIARRALEDIEFHGHIIKKNAGVLLMLAAANRDPGKFYEPGDLDLTRSPNAYLSFGKGEHVCMGRPLVKQLLEQFLRVWIRGEYDLNPSTDRLVWQHRAGHRWLEKLPITMAYRG